MGRGRPRKEEYPATAIGRNMARLRAEAGLSQKDLAQACGLRQNDISRIESGAVQNPPASKLRVVALALGVPLAAFWEGDIEPNPSQLRLSLRAFLDSPLGAGVTQEEVHELEGTRWPWGELSITAWYHVLQAIRAQQRVGD